MSPETLVKIATRASMVVAFILAAAKGYVWYRTGSVTIQASLLDSLLDMLASATTVVAVYHAARPADTHHQFGHGKLEALVSLGQALVFGASFLWVVKEALTRGGIGHHHSHEPWLFPILLISILLTFGLVVGQRYVIRQTSSLAVESDSLHYQGDLLINIATLVGFFCFHMTGWQWIDSVAGVGIGLYVVRTSWTIAKRACDVLMDKELSEDVREKIMNLAVSYPGVRDVHGLKTRTSGTQEFIQLHLGIDPDMSLRDAHGIAKEVSNAITRVFPRAEILIHQDPFPEE